MQEVTFEETSKVRPNISFIAVEAMEKHASIWNLEVDTSARAAVQRIR